MSGVLFSFICPSNRPDMVDSCIRASLQKQTNNSYELIVVDTLLQRFDSASQALNFGAEKAKGEYLVFLHHDIIFDAVDFLNSLALMVKSRSFCIAGVAGIIKGSSPNRCSALTNIVHGEEKETPLCAVSISEITPCDTLDECFFVIPKKVWQTRPLSVFYPSWHLYAVEYSLWANHEDPGSCVALPLTLWHKSKGVSFDESYYRAVSVLRKLYKPHYDVIYSSCGIWPTSLMPFLTSMVVHRLRRLYHAIRKHTGL